MNNIKTNLVYNVKNILDKYEKNNKFGIIERLRSDIDGTISTIDIDEYKTQSPILPGIKGFPSGHSQTAMLFASFFSLYIYSHSDSYLKYIPISIIILSAMFIMISRKLNGCHTPLQILVGGFFGIILGIGGYIGFTYLPSYISPDSSEKVLTNYKTLLIFAAAAFGIILITFAITSAL
jgi:hypothetical protein